MAMCLCVEIEARKSEVALSICNGSAAYCVSAQAPFRRVFKSLDKLFQVSVPCQCSSQGMSRSTGEMLEVFDGDVGNCVQSPKKGFGSCFIKKHISARFIHISSSRRAHTARQNMTRLANQMRVTVKFSA
jgi:hypothetical protein